MSNTVNTIRVHVDPPYTVSIGSGLLARCGELLRPVLGDCRLCAVADSNVAPLYLSTVTESLRSAGYAVSTCLYPAGRPIKTWRLSPAFWNFWRRSI